MTWIVSALIGGTIMISYLDVVPGRQWALAWPVLALAWWRWPRWRQPLAIGQAFICGALWLSIAAEDYLQRRAELAGLDEATAEVRVLGLPVQRAGRLTFRVEATGGSDLKAGDRLQLNWVDNPVVPQPGDIWRLKLRLRTLRGSLNPVGFDTERWGFVEQIHGRGYVLSASRVRQGSAPSRWRVKLAQRLLADPAQSVVRPLLAALAVGDRRALNDQHWTVLQATGTSHLMAISGLHIGLVAGLAALLGRAVALLAGLLGVATRRLADLPAVLSLLAATSYAALAGFALPTQRALAMLVVLLAGLRLRRFVSPPRSLALAALVTIAVDPMAPLRPGFWLSFAAVAVLLYGLSGRRFESRLQSWWRAQWVVVIGLLPVLAAAGLPVSPVAPAINLLAIPWVGCLVLPPLLLGVALASCGASWSDWLLAVAEANLSVAWRGLDWVARMGLVWQPPALSGPLLAWLVLGALLSLMPKGIPARYLGLLALVPLLQAKPGPLPVPLRLHVLDVGQGLAVFVETEQQLLLYDTGPASRWGWTAAATVVLPFARDYLRRAPDVVMVSHGDADHAGGVSLLRPAWPRAKWLSGTGNAGQRCVRGQHWRAGPVRFAVLHPTEKLPYLGNDSSCVLAIQLAERRILFPGDISKVVEQRLLRDGQHRLDLIVTPHHGSRTSSHHAFVQRIRPRWTVISSGFGNRFGLPHPEIVQRYRAVGSGVVDTSGWGYLRFAVDAHGVVLEHAERRDRRRLWHWPPAAAR